MDTSGSAVNMEVIANIFDEKVISPMGFLMSKQVVDQADPASTLHKYIDLPTDWPIRKLILRAEEDGVAPWTNISHLKVDEDNEVRVPIDVAIEDYCRVMKGVWTPVEEQFIGRSAIAGQTLYATPTDYYATLCGAAVGLDDTFSTDGYSPGGKIQLASPTGATVKGTARGYLPNHCVEFPFGLQDDLDDWFDVSKVGSLRARVTGGGTGIGGTHQIALQQLRRY